MVSEAAPGRDMIQGEVPAAQGGAAGLQHMLAAGFRIGGVVLVVPVHGDNPQSGRPLVQEIPECGFQGGALAPVYLVMEQVDFRVLGSQTLEIMEIFRFASIVHQNNIGKPIFQQAVDYGNQLLIRIQGRQDHGNTG